MKTIRISFVVIATAMMFSLTSARAEQPKMEAALRALRAARAELQAASHDKGGHRVKALEHVNQAIAEVERGMEFDRRH
jgi:type II secretory pathway pseudopilin PulG